MTAFINGKSANCGNTTTNGNEVRLFGNRIIWRDENGEVYVSSCGWPSYTTKERLNGFFILCSLSYYIGQKNFQWFLCRFYSPEVRFEWDSNHEYSLAEIKAELEANVLLKA